MSKCTAFLQTATKCLDAAVKNDRLSVLGGDHMPGSLKLDDISPRNRIPEEYRLFLRPFGSNGFTIALYQREKNGSLKPIVLPDKDGIGTATVVEDSLMNIKAGLRQGVVAFEGANCLYQTSPARREQNAKQDGDDQIRITLEKVQNDGSLGGPRFVSREIRVLGVNPNFRILQLEDHIARSEPEELFYKPLRHFIGHSVPTTIGSRGSSSLTLPSSFYDLNAVQQSVADPTKLTTAREVAGPPGTGKTKTITELVRALLKFTSYDVVVLSERNGAIDAIAEKIAHDCVKFVGDTADSVSDKSLWMKLLAFGSSGMGPSTRLFTPESKFP